VSRAADGRGVLYDTCPHDGCLEVQENSFKSGGMVKGEVYHDWSLFSADRRKGGCGAAWSRTTKQGVAYNDERGRSTAWKTQDAEVNRTYWMPSDAYRANFDRIFRKGDADGGRKG
jgi:hypothetical protein